MAGLPRNPRLLDLPNPPDLPEHLRGLFEPKEPGGPRGDLDHLSYSSLSLYQYCSRAWWFQYVKLRRSNRFKPPLEVGKVFHAVLEIVVRERLRQGLPVTDAFVLEAMEHQWGLILTDPSINWGSELPDEFHTLLYRLLMTKEARQVMDTLDPYIWVGEPLLELPFGLVIPGIPIPITGKIDFLLASGCTPLDFKTSAYSWSPEKAQHELQPEVYVDVLDQIGLGALNPSRFFGHVVFVKTREPKVQLIWTHRSTAQTEVMRRVARSVWRAIVAAQFPMNVMGWKCSPKMCDVWDLCRGATPLPEHELP